MEILKIIGPLLIWVFEKFILRIDKKGEQLKKFISLVEDIQKDESNPVKAFKNLERMKKQLIEKSKNL